MDTEPDGVAPQKSRSSLMPGPGKEGGDEKKRLDDINESVSPKPTPAAGEADPNGLNPDISEAPEGGLRAWLVVVGSGFVFFSCLGFVNTFGVFQQYYMSHQLRNHTPDNIAWIGALMAFVQSGAGAITGSLFDRFGARVVGPGAVIYVFALMMTSICTEYWQFILAQGLLAGFGMSLLQMSAFACVSQYFQRKRATALGIVVSGSSIGGIIFPIALSKMLNNSSLGFGWSVRVIAFVIAPLLAFASLTVRPRAPPRMANFFLWEAFKNVKFLMLVFAMFGCFIGMLTPLFYLPTYAVSRGMDPTLASYLLAIVNAASTAGRIIPGMLADKYGRLNGFGIGGILTGVIVLCMNSAVGTAALVVYSIAFGFASGTIVSGASAAISVCTDDPRNLGTYIGMGMAIASTANLVGPPINGVLLDTHHNFLQVSIFSGIFSLAGGVLAIITKAATPQGIFGRI
ncbi:hypothetical protein VTI28DRAFT_3832 [Corynascus sepedonium]